MSVPETAVREQHSAPSWKNDIGPSRQRSMKPEPESCHVQRATQENFRLRVFSANAGHHPASNLWFYDISH
jgi:hypothetical protein